MRPEKPPARNKDRAGLECRRRPTSTNPKTPRLRVCRDHNGRGLSNLRSGASISSPIKTLPEGGSSKQSTQQSAAPTTGLSRWGVHTSLLEARRPPRIRGNTARRRRGRVSARQLPSKEIAATPPANDKTGRSQVNPTTSREERSARRQKMTSPGAPSRPGRLRRYAPGIERKSNDGWVAPTPHPNRSGKARSQRLRTHFSELICTA